MKRITLILILVSFAYPQNRVVKSFILKYAENPNATILNGTNQYWTKASSSVNFERTTAFSIIAVFKPSAGVANQTVISARGSDATSRGWSLALGSNNLISFGIISDLAGSNFINGNTDAGGGAVNTDKLYCVVATYDGSSVNTGLKVYVNGDSLTLTRTGTMSTTIAGSAPLNIGARNSTDRFFGGMISDVQIVSGKALTAAEAKMISLTYKDGMPPVYESASIVAWYNWQSGGFDKSGRGNHLTKVNDPIIVKVKQ